jgi:hypothetical protein
VKFKFNIVILILIIILSACGYKNAPKSKDSFVIKVPENINLDNTENGIKISNNNDKYFLIIEKAEKNSTCVSEFKFVKTLKPKEIFTDTQIKPGKSYIYKLYYLDNKLKINSKPKVISKTFLPPIKVKELQIQYLNDESILIKPIFSYSPLYYKVFLNDKLIFQTAKKECKLILANTEINFVKIIPYDQYDNRGNIFVKEVINRKKIAVLPPENIKFILGFDNFIIIWNEAKGAEGYYVFNSYSKETKRVDLPKVEFKRPPKGCYFFKIASFNKYGKSKFKRIDYCIP